MTERPSGAEQAPTTVVGALPGPVSDLAGLAEPSALSTAIRVGCELLAHYGDSSRDDFSYPEAYGAIRESLRILLRALGAETDGAKGTQIVGTPGAEAAETVSPTVSKSYTPGSFPGSQEVATPPNGVANHWSEGWTSMTNVQLPDGPTAGHRDQRCPAAHPEDPTPCDGPPAVTVLDATNAGADGCEHHAARLLASLDGGRVYPLPDAPEGAAIRVFKAADGIRPFPWVDAPRTQPSQLSRAENRERGEDR